MLLILLSFMAYYLRMLPVVGRFFHFPRSDTQRHMASSPSSPSPSSPSSPPPPSSSPSSSSPPASTSSTASAASTASSTSEEKNSYLFPRKWIQAENLKENGHPEISVASYNLLCQNFISPFHYPNCAKRFKTQDYRHFLLLMELDQQLGADLYGFQEVSPAYYQVLRPDMEARGYEGYYQKKMGNGVDGLATFYKRDLFEKLEVRSLDLNVKADLACQKMGVNPNQIAVLQNTVAQFGLLRLKHADPAKALPLLFGNVHIHYDWTRNDVQALQIAFTVQALAEFAAEKERPAFILCGDFNIQPFTPAYSLLMNGSWKEEEWRRGQSVPLKEGGRNKYVAELLAPYYHHPASSIRSAYKVVTGSEPVTTNSTADFTGCLDYMLYDSDKIEPTAVLALVGEELIKPLGGCPNQKFPSDHMSLQSKFRIMG